MECPYCNLKMERGYIPSVHGEVEWIPEKEEISFFIGGKVDGGIKLTKAAYFKPKKKEAFLCRSCKKIIMNFNSL